VAFVGTIICCYVTNHYHKPGTVVTVYKDTILIEDTEGEVWEFYGDNFEVGDNVEMTMFTNFTKNNFYDDVVEKVKIKR
jgi:hypothetical protein